jgi:hypothetical protein
MSCVSKRLLHFPGVHVFSVLAALGVLLLPSAAGGQPFGAWSIFSATQGKYFDIASSPDLNPTEAITIEAWVALSATSAQGQNAQHHRQGLHHFVLGRRLREHASLVPQGGFLREERRHRAEQPVDARRGDV